MWMMSFVPDSFLLYVINTILLVGAVGSFLTFFALNRILRWFPAIAPYYLILQIISAVLLVGGIYFKGGYGVEMSWRDKVRQLEEKVKAAEAKSQEVKIQIQEKIVYKTKVVKEKETVYIDRIKEIAKEIDAKCEVDPRVIEELNKASEDPFKGDAK